MYVKMNTKELAEFKKEVVSDALKQQIRQCIDEAFTDEVKSTLQSKIDSRMRGWSGEELVDKALQKVIIRKFPNVNAEMRDIRDTVRARVDKEVNAKVKTMVKTITESTERRLLKDIKNQLEGVRKQLQ